MLLCCKTRADQRCLGWWPASGLLKLDFGILLPFPSSRRDQAESSVKGNPHLGLTSLLLPTHPLPGFNNSLPQLLSAGSSVSHKVIFIKQKLAENFS